MSEHHQDYCESLYGESEDHQVTVICIASLKGYLKEESGDHMLRTNRLLGMATMVG